MNVNFVMSSNSHIVIHSCRLCSIKFTFKNKFFVHLREKWKTATTTTINNESSSSISVLQHDSISIETTNNRLLIQSFVVFIEFIEQTFRDCHYATTKIKVFFKKQDLEIMLKHELFYDDWKQTDFQIKFFKRSHQATFVVYFDSWHKQHYASYFEIRRCSFLF